MVAVGAGEGLKVIWGRQWVLVGVLCKPVWLCVSMCSHVSLPALSAAVTLISMLQWHCIEAGAWPFQRLADQLCCDVLSPVWTVRHGAAAGLRELLREQAAAAGVEAPLADPNTGWACPGNTGRQSVGRV